MLKSGNVDVIQTMMADLDGQAKRLTDDIIQLTYFMRGSIPYEEMWKTTPFERQRIGKFIESRFEQEKKNPHPVY